MKNLRSFIYVPLFLLFISITALGQTKGGYTLSQVMSSPYPTELTAAADGGRIAWAFDAQGKRNIWVASAPDFKARQLTHYNVDDGQEITELSMSRDGSVIAYTRGGDKNSAGEIPNPADNPGGEKQEVWAIRWDGVTPHLMGEGSSPAVSPSGEMVAFVKEGQIWLSPSSGAKEKKQAFVGRGINGSVSWLPDSESFVFV